jgi:hypothetical protein
MAWVNACMFIGLDFLMFTNIFNNCFCRSAVFGLGAHHAFIVVSVDSSIYENWWIASLSVATMAALLLWITIFVLKTQNKFSPFPVTI